MLTYLLINERKYYFSIAIITVGIFLVGYMQYNVSGQTFENGIIGQVVDSEKTQFYVRGVNVTDEPESKIVNVSIVFKNKDSSQQRFSPNSLRLVDSQSREYKAEHAGVFPPVYPLYLPHNDTLIDRSI